MANLESFLTDSVVAGSMYVNLGLTLAAAFAWARTSDVFLKSVIGKKNPYLYPIMLTVFSMIVFTITNRIQTNRIKQLKQKKEE